MLDGVEATVKLAHNNIKVTSQCGLKRVRQGFGYIPDVLQENVFFYNNSVSVMLRALTERLYYVKGKDGFVPCPRPIISYSTLSRFRTRVRKALQCMPPVWTHDEFVASYTGSKQRRYASAVASLARRGLRKSDGYLKTFIKAELYNGTTKADPCPRLIQPRSAEYNVELGCYLRPAEKLIYGAIDRVFGHHVVLKCDNMFKRANVIRKYWGEFSKPCFVGLDASRFDQHVSPEALRYEHGLYNSIFKDSKLAEILEWQVMQRGFADMPDGSIEYTVEGCRASGDMNTALGNVFIMCAVTQHFLETLPCKWRFINDGDDCGIFLEAENVHLLDQLPQHHLLYGFEMEVEAPVYEIEHVEFCQCRPVQLNESEWMMVRNVHKAMRNDYICITSTNWITTEEVLIATGRCGVALYGDLPILGALYSSMLRFEGREHAIEHVLATKDGWRKYLTGNRELPVDETIARVSMYKAFGILPDEQEHLEARYRALDPPQINNSQGISPKLPLFSDPRARYNSYIDI